MNRPVITAPLCPNCAGCPPPEDEHEAKEREHMGCAHKGTGIYSLEVRQAIAKASDPRGVK